MKITKAIIKKFDSVLKRGLSCGLGSRSRRMCVEAAICYALDLPHGDDPKCVTEAIRRFKIGLNDCDWSTYMARAAGLRAVGIAQLGSYGVISGDKFVDKLIKKFMTVLVPTIIQEILSNSDSTGIKKALARLNKFNTKKSLKCLEEVINDAYYDGELSKATSEAYSNLSSLVFYDSWGINEDDLPIIAHHASLAHNKFKKNPDPDKYLKMAADLALEVLKELKSPGCAWI